MIFLDDLCFANHCDCFGADVIKFLRVSDDPIDDVSGLVCSLGWSSLWIIYFFSQVVNHGQAHIGKLEFTLDDT